MGHSGPALRRHFACLAFARHPRTPGVCAISDDITGIILQNVKFIENRKLLAKEIHHGIMQYERQKKNAQTFYEFTQEYSWFNDTHTWGRDRWGTYIEEYGISVYE